jgi:uncharacterized membrane protein
MPLWRRSENARRGDASSLAKRVTSWLTIAAAGGETLGFGRAELVYAINTILLLYSWIVAAILISFLLLIGRFYEIKFGQKSYYPLLSIPLACFLIAAVWYAFFAPGNDFVGVLGPDLLLVGGGLLLIGLCYVLFRMMMGGR